MQRRNIVFWLLVGGMWMPQARAEAPPVCQQGNKPRVQHRFMVYDARPGLVDRVTGNPLPHPPREYSDFIERRRSELDIHCLSFVPDGSAQSLFVDASAC